MRRQEKRIGGAGPTDALGGLTFAALEHEVARRRLVISR